MPRKQHFPSWCKDANAVICILAGWRQKKCGFREVGPCGESLQLFIGQIIRVQHNR
jgi:hypothetical protein